MAPVDAPPLTDAAGAVSYLEEISPEMWGCAILSEGGDVLAASGDPDEWGEAGRDLVAAADAAGGEPVAHAHVATGDGEAFCVRESGLVAVAVAERFTLASLMLFDMLVTLRRLAARGHGVLGADEAPPAAARPRLELRGRGRGLHPPAPSPAQAIRKDVLQWRAERGLARRLGGGASPVPGRLPVDRGGGSGAAVPRHEAGGGCEAAERELMLVEPDIAARVLERALSRGGDFAELFCEERRGFTLSIDESRVERPQSGSERGAGIRVIDGEVTRLAHVDGLAEEDLLRAADGLASALSGDPREPLALKAGGPPRLQEIQVDPASVPAERKAEVLRELDERARSAGHEIAQASASYSEGRRRVAVFNSEGLEATDDRTRVRLGAQVVARKDGTVETGFETLGAHRGFELLDGDPGRIAEQAARKALDLLGADPAPAGEMTVVVGKGFGGVLFHEMTGHGLEADAVQKGASVYQGKMGEKVAEPLLNAFDDGTMPGEWGTGAIDDEGTPCHKTAVIEEGRLTSYLYDRLRAGRDGVESTGNGRRASFRDLPIPRMTNTYIEPGDATPDQMISEVDRGFYAVSFGGGQVEPATGDFVFGVSEGYLIEGGKVTKPCRGATLIGNCLQALARIDAVGSDFEMKTGFCGKAGQTAPVGTGQGHVRIKGITVGGTAV